MSNRTREQKTKFFGFLFSLSTPNNSAEGHLGGPMPPREFGCYTLWGKGSSEPCFTPRSLPSLKAAWAQRTPDHHSARAVSCCFVFHWHCPESKGRNSSSSCLHSALKYVFYIRFAHQFASQWNKILSFFLLKRKFQLFIATEGNNEWLQEPLNNRPPSKQFYKQSFSTTAARGVQAVCAPKLGQVVSGNFTSQEIPGNAARRLPGLGCQSQQSDHGTSELSQESGLVQVSWLLTGLKQWFTGSKNTVHDLRQFYSVFLVLFICCSWGERQNMVHWEVLGLCHSFNILNFLNLFYLEIDTVWRIFPVVGNLYIRNREGKVHTACVCFFTHKYMQQRKAPVGERMQNGSCFTQNWPAPSGSQTLTVPLSAQTGVSPEHN